MKRIAATILAAIMLLSLGACGSVKTEEEPNGASIEPSVSLLPSKSVSIGSTEPTVTTQQYPYEDAEGRMRYQLVINGEVVETENLPFSLSGEEGAYYPLEDVLHYFGVSCVVSENSRSATGRVNGKVFEVQARLSKIVVENSTINSEAVPQYVGDCLYVPSFLFMELMDATVDFTTDRSGATLITDIVINSEGSTTRGLTLPDNTYGDGGVQLTLSAQGQSACAKLFFADATGKGEELLSVFIDPNEVAALYFPPGTYILKLAYGDLWISEEEAFGEAGVYSSTEAYTFKQSAKYELAPSSVGGDFYPDSQGGFTGNG